MTSSASPPSLDPVSVTIVFATWLGATTEAATILSAYGLILLCAIAGAGIAASGVPNQTKLGTVLHIFRGVGFALIGTVPLAEVIARSLHVDIRWLFSPLAVLIASRPDLLVAGFRAAVCRVLGGKWGSST